MPSLGAMNSLSHTVRVAAFSDTHVPRTALGVVQAILAEIEGRADVLCLCGDITDTGHPEDARGLVKALAGLKIPTIAVLGNHDHEAGRADEIKAMLNDGGVHVLDGDAYETHGIGFAGVK